MKPANMFLNVFTCRVVVVWRAQFQDVPGPVWVLVT